MGTVHTDTVHVIDRGVSDVLREDDVVHIPAAVAELAESLKREGSSFVPDVPNWDDSPE